MNGKPKQRKKRPAAFRIALWVFAGAASLVLLVLIAVLCLPTLVSTAWFTQIIEQRASLALNRTVSIDRVSWKWSDSLRIEGIRLPDDPLFSHRPLMTVDRVNLEIHYVEIFSKRIHADLVIDGLTLRIIRNTAGASNLEHLLSPLAPGNAASAPPPPVDKTLQIPVLPLNLQLGLKLTDSALFMDDRKAGKKIDLQRTALEFNLLSLSRGRVNLAFAGDVSVDGTRLPRSHLRLVTDRLFTPTGALNITDAVAEFDARLPGIQVHVDKPAGFAGLDSSIKIDLASLFDLAGTLSPASLPLSDLKGLVEINLKGSGNPRTTVRFDSRINARNVELTGKWTGTGGKTVGPLKVAFRQAGEIIFNNSTLILETGFLHILDNSRFEWQGRLNGFDRKGRDVQFQLNLASHLDLQELAQAVKPLWKDILGEARLQGSLSLDVETSGSALPQAVYDLTVEGQGIRAAGGPIKNTAIGPVAFTLSQKGSVDLPGQNLVIESGKLTFMQQTSVAWKGRVEGFNGKVEDLKCDAELQTNLDLPSLLKTLQPLIPDAISDTAVKGQVALEALASGRPWGGLQFDTRVEARNIGLSGSALKGKTVGPLTVSLTNRGAIDLSKDTLAIHKGALRVQKNSRAAWDGTLYGMRSALPEMKFTIHDVSLELDEIIQPLAAFVPQQLSLGHNGLSTPSVLTMERFDLSGTIPTGGMNALLSNLELKIPQAAYATAEGDISAAGVFLGIKTLRGEIVDLFPQRILFSAAFKAGKLQAAGAVPFRLNDLDIPDLTIRADDICRSQKGLLGIQSRLALRQSMRIGQIDALQRLRLNDLTQGFDGECTIDPQGGARLALDRLDLKARELTVEDPRLGTLKTGLDMRVNMTGAELKQLDPLDVDIERLQAAFGLGDMLNVSASAHIANTGKDVLKTEGSLSLDLADLSAMIPDNFVTMRQLDGSARLQWKLDGRQPDQGEIQRLTTLSMNDRTPLLPFVNHLEIALSLDRIMADAGFNDDSGLKVGPVSTRSPLKYAYDGATSRGELSADILVNQITAIPSLQFDDPLDTEITFRVTHDALDSVRLAQSFSVRPLNVVQSADVSLSGLADLVQNRSAGILQAMLHYLEGDARLKLDVLEDADFSAITEELAITGSASAGMTVQMKPRQRFGIEVWAKIPGMDLQMGEEIRFEQLTADIDLFRRYRMFADDPLTKPGPREPGRLLSEDVLDYGNDLPEDLDPGAAQLSFFNQARNRFGLEHSLTWDSAAIHSTPIPLQLQNAKMNVGLGPGGMPGVHFFQVDVLGGTIVGSTSFGNVHDDYFLKVHVAYSGLDGNRVFPDPEHTYNQGESEISGQIVLQVPIATDLKRVIQESSVELVFSHIGPRALERLLYAMDPYESNEAIVSQRRLLRIGTPRWITISIKDGALSMEGAMSVKGVDVAIPSLKRLNISGLSGLDRYEGRLMLLEPLIDALDIVSADEMRVDKGGRTLTFK